jgi:hypothetical protein
MKLKSILFIVFGGLLLLSVFFPFALYFFGCQTNNTCTGIPEPDTTPIPTLAAATMPAPKVGANAGPVTVKCQVAAVDLIGAWVNAGYPEKDAFDFTDAKGQSCAGTYETDIQRLFSEANLWYSGSPACTTCHYADVVKATFNMDMSSYAGVIAGSQRKNGEPKGKDILGGGKWEESLLYQMLYAPGGVSTINRPLMPLGRPADGPEKGPVIYAGTPKP